VTGLLDAVLRAHVRGLRREELALLAGISAEYYLRLEQGRDKNPSQQILDALARALQLDIKGTEYLYQLAGGSHGQQPDLETAADGLDALIDQFPMPAIIANRYQDVLAANAIARALSPGFAPGQNFLRWRPDPQPDRGQRRSLQPQSTRHRVGCPPERHHEAVAFTLFDRPHPAVLGDDLGQDAIQPLNSGAHLLGLGLPQPCGAFDVGKKQRHRSGRQQLAHAQLAPVHQRRRLRAGVSFAHASQHARTAYGETSALTRRSRPVGGAIYDPVTTFSTRSGRWSGPRQIAQSKVTRNWKEPVMNRVQGSAAVLTAAATIEQHHTRSTSPTGTSLFELAAQTTPEARTRPPILITEKEVLLSTAAAVSLRPTTIRWWTKATGAVLAAVHPIVLMSSAEAAPLRRDCPSRLGYLEPALMAREMDRL
jgi:transcriptional regulator with XRE-family HTH domain